MFLGSPVKGTAMQPGQTRQAFNRFSRPRWPGAALIVAFKEEGKVDRAERHRKLGSRGREAVNKILQRSKQPGTDLLDGKMLTKSRPLTSEPASTSQQPAPAPLPTPELGPAKPLAFEASLSVPVFSRRREVFVGRVAMAGFYATCMWESFLMGPGPVSQLSILSGLPHLAVQGVLLGFVLHGVWGLSPTTPTWSAQNREDMLRRPKGPPRKFVNPISDFDKFFGFAPFEWGFLKRNELFAGRLAMLGFLGTCMAEGATWGRGALGQIAWWLHLPVSQSYYQFCNWLLVIVSVVFAVLAYVNRHPFEVKGGDDIYL